MKFLSIIAAGALILPTAAIAQMAPSDSADQAQTTGKSKKKNKRSAQTPADTMTTPSTDPAASGTSTLPPPTTSDPATTTAPAPTDPSTPTTPPPQS